jgi:transposase
MPRPRLSDSVIAERMTELRNLRRLHARDRTQITALKAANKTLRAENAALRESLAAAQAQLNTQAIQIAELQTMVFGKHKKHPPAGSNGSALPEEPVPLRTAASYRRPLPPVSAVTSEVDVPLPDQCPCGGSFVSITLHERFEEDIPLPELTPDYRPHLVTKYVVERGVCNRCGVTFAGRELGGQPVTLGPNVRLLVSHLVSLAGMSYAQVAQLLLALYHLPVSDGEIADMLQQQYRTWLPAYHRLAGDIRASPVQHHDESPWALQAEDKRGYVWVSSDDRSEKTVFYAANSRGSRNARRLFGNHPTGVHITNDYGPYRTLPEQQLCWAHLYRAIRDLVSNKQLSMVQQPYVQWWYGQFAAIYEDLRLYLAEPYDEVVRSTQADELWQRTEQLAVQPVPPQGEPVKLHRLKAQLLRAGKDKLFVCLPKDTPCDNNRAERDLRPLVLKRKRSFGSKTMKGARALMDVASICVTTWRCHPTDYFKALAAVG